MAAIHAPQHVPHHAPQRAPRHGPQRIPHAGYPPRREPQSASGPNLVSVCPRGARAAPPYGRRRLLVVVALAVAVIGLVMAVERVAGDGGSAAAGGRQSQPTPIAGEVYVVQPGDNLWSIAERLAPGDDPRPVVRELRERHGGVQLEVGDRVPIDGLGD
jgi:hypothetical protein